jgi:hypothetical protein
MHSPKEAVVTQPAKQNKIDPRSVEGLEAVFDLAPVTIEEEPITGTGTEPVTSTQEPVTDAIEVMPGIPIELAAEQIGSSVNALKKRLRKGTVRGVKQETKHGEKWFVEPSEIRRLAPVTIKSTPVTSTGAAPEPDKEAPVTGANFVSRSDVLLVRIQELEQKLEGATFRNGYLEAENEGLKALLGAQETHIKLLTDSQHKSGFWKGFWSWFTGR